MMNRFQTLLVTAIVIGFGGQVKAAPARSAGDNPKDRLRDYAVIRCVEEVFKREKLKLPQPSEEGSQSWQIVESSKFGPEVFEKLSSFAENKAKLVKKEEFLLECIKLYRDSAVVKLINSINR